MTSLDLHIASDQRVALFGQTGMGKTTLVQKLIAPQPRVIVVDSKGMIDWPGYHLTDNPVAALMEDKVIYRPPSGAPPKDWWMEAVHRLHERGGGVIYVDEGSYVTGSNTIDKGLADAIRLGRQLGIGIWFAAQESVSVHNTTFRQAEVVIMFYNQGASDREKLAKAVGDMAYTTAHLREYQWVVFVRGQTYDHDSIPVYQVVL